MVGLECQILRLTVVMLKPFSSSYLLVVLFIEKVVCQMVEYHGILFVEEVGLVELRHSLLNSFGSLCVHI